MKHYLILALLLTALALVIAGTAWFTVTAWAGAVETVLK
jgi:hypothetical protein